MKEYLFKNIYKILLRKSGIWTKTTLFLCLLGSVNWDFTSYCCSQEHRIPSLLSSLMEGFFFFLKKSRMSVLFYPVPRCMLMRLSLEQCSQKMVTLFCLTTLLKQWLYLGQGLVKMLGPQLTFLQFMRWCFHTILSPLYTEHWAPRMGMSLKGKLTIISTTRSRTQAQIFLGREKTREKGGHKTDSSCF